MTSAHAALLLVVAASAALGAQDSPTPRHTIHGQLATLQGAPVSGANIFLLEALDVAMSDSAGRFVVTTRAQGRVTVVARHIGFAPATAEVPVDTGGPITLTLLSQAAALVPITVQAGAYRAGNERGATLTALEVVTTPGATADVARAIQTLPGVQNVDEGTGLFVRGGDVSETKVFLNDMMMLSPYNYATPTGNFTVTVDPFLLDGIFFSSGGFGARFGNVLSGVAALRTAGRPAQSSETMVMGLASVSTAADLALSHDVTVHATAARNDTQLLFKLNGATRSYAPAPKGEDFSGSVIYSYRPTAEIKTFAIDRRSALGIGVSDPSFSGGYSADVRSQMTQASWKDVFGAIAPTVSVSYASAHRDEGFGAYALATDERWTQAFTQTEWSPSGQYTLRIGGDADWRTTHFLGSIPLSSANVAPGTRRTVVDSPVDGTRAGTFAEADWRAREALRLIGGLRTDYSSLTRVRTADPRLSAAYKIGEATLTAAVGEYHQIPDPIYLSEGIGRSGLGPQAARQYVAGAQVGETADMARIEVYDKRYRDLVGLTRDSRTAVGGGTGEARGMDLFLRRQLWPFFAARLTYSYVDSRRTDPDTHRQAPAAFDITNSITVIGDQALPRGWSVSMAWRYATGKPFTPVTGASFDATQGVWIPVYGAPNGERLPAARRFDVALSRVTRLSLHNQLVYFVSIDNLFDRTNVYQYTYNADYSARTAVRSLFNRSIYFGGSLTHLGR